MSIRVWRIHVGVRAEGFCAVVLYVYKELSLGCRGVYVAVYCVCCESNSSVYNGISNMYIVFCLNVLATVPVYFVPVFCLLFCSYD